MPQDDQRPIGLILAGKFLGGLYLLNATGAARSADRGRRCQDELLRLGLAGGPVQMLTQLWLDLDNTHYIRDALSFPANITLRVDRGVTVEDGTVLLSDARCFLTGLDPEQVRAAELPTAVPARRQIKNSLFFLKDRWRDGTAIGPVGWVSLNG